jgi:hypothetical protein
MLRRCVAQDDDLWAMDAKRRPSVDDKTFDCLVKASVTSTGRRRLLQAVGAAGIGGLLTRGVAGAAGGEACQNRGSNCRRNRQCACKGEQNVICDPLARGCRSGRRCCGVADATCGNDCDCCKGYQCNRNQNKCIRTLASLLPDAKV